MENNIEMNKNNIYKIQVEAFQKVVASSSEEYLNIAQQVERLVSDCYQKENKKLEFPIDLNIITKYLEIEVEYEQLNRADMMQFSRTLAILTVQNGKALMTVNNSVSYKTQRYATANAIGRFLLNDATVIKSSYAIPLMPQSLEEIAADGIASFLLLPMTLFKDEFREYLEKAKDHPLDVDAWLEYLSNRSQISPFNLAIGYQQMKQILCYQRQMEFEESDYDITQMGEDQYGMIFA